MTSNKKSNGEGKRASTDEKGAAAGKTDRTSATDVKTKFTREDCVRWKSAPSINPQSGRRITEGGKVYKELLAGCKQYDLLPTNTQKNANTKDEQQKENDETGKERREELISSQGLLRSVRDELFGTSNEAKNSKNSKNSKGAKDAQNSRQRRDVHRKLDEHIRRTIDSYADGKKGETGEKGKKGRPLPLLRTVEDHLRSVDEWVPYASIEDNKVLRKLTVTNCHDGQRKLTLSLLEFIASALLRFRCAPSELLVVYAGASGLASAVASVIFPGLKLVLYDPAPNTLSHMPKSFTNVHVFRDSPFPPSSLLSSAFGTSSPSLSSSSLPSSSSPPLFIFTGRAGWFDDRVARYCRDTIFPQAARVGGVKHMLFTSDVRTENTELAIIRDMRDQMRWTMLTGCDAYMHKFRIPFPSPPSPHLSSSGVYPTGGGKKGQKGQKGKRGDSAVVVGGEIVNKDQKMDAATICRAYADLSHLPSDAYVFDSSRTNNAKARQDDTQTHVRFPYLDGELYIELFGRQRTSELRLIGFSSPVADTTHKRNYYTLREYDQREIDDVMGTFNILYRSHARYAYVSDHVPAPLCTDDKKRTCVDVPSNYETVAEHAIMWNCARALLSHRSPSLQSNGSNGSTDSKKKQKQKKSNTPEGRKEEIEKSEDSNTLALARDLHKRMNDMLQTYTPKDPIVCPLMSADWELRRKMPHVDVRTYAPHVLEWAARIRSVLPDAPIPRRFLLETDHTTRKG